MNKEERSLFINGRVWGGKKLAVKKRSGGVCERCHSAPSENVHHLTDIRYGGDELLEDLQDLCRPCHKYIHHLSDYDPLADGKLNFKKVANKMPYGWIGENAPPTTEPQPVLKPSVLKLRKDSFDKNIMHIERAHEQIIARNNVAGDDLLAKLAAELGIGEDPYNKNVAQEAFEEVRVEKDPFGDQLVSDKFNEATVGLLIQRQLNKRSPAMLFEVALIELPKPKDIEENGAMETMILPPTPVIAKDQQSAGVIAVLNNKDKITCDMTRLQVLVRPFA